MTAPAAAPTRTSDVGTPRSVKITTTDGELYGSLSRSDGQCAMWNVDLRGGTLSLSGSFLSKVLNWPIRAIWLLFRALLIAWGQFGHLLFQSAVCEIACRVGDGLRDTSDMAALAVARSASLIEVKMFKGAV